MIVEAFGVTDVLETDGVADSALHAFAVGGVRDATGHGREVGGPYRPSLALPVNGEGPGDVGGEGHGGHSGEEFGDWDWAVDFLAGDHLRARFHRVADAQLDRVHAQRRGQLVHLRLMRIAVLD